MQTSLVFYFRLLRLSVFVLISFIIFSASGQQHWTLKKDEDSIRVYTGHTNASPFKSIKATFMIKTSMSQLAAMVWNVEGYKEWQYNTILCKEVKKINEHEMMYYAVIDAPWPVSNRDMVVRLNITQDRDTKVLTISTIGEPKALPEEEDVVRVPMSEAQWIVTPVSKNRLKVEYTIQIDPGGSVPAWMVNMVCVDAPFQSFSKLRSKMMKVRNGLPYIID